MPYKDKETMSERNKRYSKTHRPQMRASLNKYHKRMRLDLLGFLGGVCVHCGFSDARALQIDHVNGGGTKQRKELGRDTKYSQYIREHTTEFQLLCANCNWIKRAENREYHHSDE